MKSIQQILRNAAPHWVGDGFPVRSLLSYSGGNRFDPFLLLDYAGPYEFAPAEAQRGVGEHPHRGFETVTIVYQGELEHGDSAGNRGTIGPGDVQWMTAAAGVVHREHHSERFARAGGVLEMVQLWVNLPAKDKTSPPRYQEILSARIPVVELPDGAGSVRVIAGDFQGTAGPAQTFTPLRLWDLRLASGGRATFEVDDGATTLLVVQRGTIVVNGQESVGAVEVVQFDRAGTEFTLEAQQDAMALVLSGAPIGEPVAGQGPFVMNTREEILQAIADFQGGRF
ncbi:MAG TPA: pirin family protein [Lacipirellulaceae bacterium]|nr:pirin family protein [Lacipirellulaceae bacterium]HMP05990.1 pirin family protein [Lacipirellulaceae bacterium]